MRPTPAPHPGTDRRPFEARVRFHAPPLRAELIAVGATAAAPPPPRDSSPAPRGSAVPTTPTPPTAPPAAAAPPTDFRETDAGRELLADRERIETALREIRAGVAEVRENQGARLKEWQRAAVELAMTIATRLLHERVASGEFPVEAKVRDMIAQFPDESPVTVSLNPADLDLLASRLGGEPLTRGRDDPRFVPDPALGRGGCRVEGRESMLLSDVSRELQEIRDELLRSLGHARS